MHPYKDLFHLPDDLIYLNCSYMAPLLKEAEDAGIAAIRKRGNPLNIGPDEFFRETNEIRSVFGKLINAAPERIVLVPSVSYGMANVAKNIHVKAHQKIIVAGGQFPSNYYPWKRVSDETGCTLQIVWPDDQVVENRAQEWNECLLQAIDETVAMVAISHVHWANGTLFNLKAIREKTRSVGALMVIDGTQSVGALPFDVNELAPDALICAGYKWLLGPYSLGLAYYGPAFDNGVPVEENWMNRLESEKFSGLVNYHDQYQQGSLRYEMGEHSNFNLAPILKCTLQKVLGWTPELVQDHCKKIAFNALGLLAEMRCRIENESGRAWHLLGIGLPENIAIDKLKSELQKENISISFRGNSIRVAPHLYNTEEELIHFTKVVERSYVSNQL